jgi:DNA gyrase/topoisomerase IV subunit A
MTPKTAALRQELVALDGKSATGEVEELRAEITRLKQQLEEERASAAALYSQLTVLSHQLEDARRPPSRGRLGRKGR